MRNFGLPLFGYMNLSAIEGIPLSYLRDQCRCSKCFSQKTGERIHKLKNFDPNVEIETCKIEGKHLIIIWKDGHIQKCKEEQIDEIKKIFSDKTLDPILWDASFAIPSHNYNSLNLKLFLSDFLMYGIVRVEDSPVRNKFVEEFANSIACVREIVFDRVADIVVKEKAYTQGFTPVDLPLHTDVSGYRWPPSVFLFHCLENTAEGGENLYSDGFQSIENLKKTRNKSFLFLQNNDIGFRLFSKSHDTKTVAKVFELDEQKKPSAIRYANWALNPISLDVEYCQNFYTSLADLAFLMEKNQIEIRLNSGDLLMVNNQRVLHGRKMFNHLSGKRHFQQVYMEIDDIEAKWRKLN